MNGSTSLVALLMSVAVALSACTTTTRLYDGAELPPAQVAILTGDRLLEILSIDGKTGDFTAKVFRGPWTSAGFAVQLLPGPHSVKVKYREFWVGAPVTLDFEAQAGKVYRIAYELFRDKGIWRARIEEAPAEPKGTAGDQCPRAQADALARATTEALEQGRYAAAEQLGRRALALREQCRDELDRAGSMGDLALVLRRQGKFAEAARLSARSLALFETHAGAKHPSTAGAVLNYGLVFSDEAKFADAERHFRRALSLFEQASGPEHADTALCADHVGLALSQQGKYQEAEPFNRRALAIYEKAHGPKHPKTADGLENLGRSLEGQAKHVEAEALLRRALAIREQFVGAQHPDTARTLDNIGLALEGQGKYGEAEQFRRRALEVVESALGSKHPETASIQNNLGALLGRQGKRAEAESYFRKALAIRTEALGWDHPYTVTSANNLVLALELQQKYPEAESLLRRLLQSAEHTGGPDSLSVAAAQYSLGTNLQRQNRVNDAQDYLRRALKIQTARLGSDHPDTRKTASAEQALRLQAKIEADIAAHQRSPRKKFVGARPEERFARYERDWRAKVERVGNENYPQEARGRLYGSVGLTVSIRADGGVESVQIDRSSGHDMLDQAAVRIVGLASPFAPFPPEISRDTDLLVITRTWFFTRDHDPSAALCVDDDWTWRAAAIQAIRAQVRYPREAATRKVEGTASIEISVDRRGKPVQAAIKESSGSAVLDAEALAAARRTTFPPAPRCSDQAGPMSHTVPVVFTLEVLEDWAHRIRAKIRSSLSIPAGTPPDAEATFTVVQLPTGEIVSVRLRSPSGFKPFDEATEQAILRSSPLPTTRSPTLFRRDLELKFKASDR